MRTWDSLLTNRRIEDSVVSSENGNDPGKCRPVNGIAIQARQMSSNVMVLGFANVFLVCMLSLDVIVSAHFLDKEN